MPTANAQTAALKMPVVYPARPRPDPDGWVKILVATFAESDHFLGWAARQGYRHREAKRLLDGRVLARWR